MTSPACVVGVDLGGTKLLAGVVDARLNVHHRTQRTIAGLGQAALLDAVADAVTEVGDLSGIEPSAAGFGIPALIDRRTGTAAACVHLPLEGVAFGDLMAERLDLPCVVDNDANMAALAEHRFGAARGVAHAIVLTIGTGIGSGLILNGALYRGAIGAGGELGHMVVDADGPLCQGACPNRGCLEAVASGSALVREARREASSLPASALGQVLSAGREVSGPMVTELAHDGDVAAQRAIARIGSQLGAGLSSIANIFNPELIVIGGGVIAAGELLLTPAREELERRALAPNAELVRVVPAQFGAEAGMLGAATLAREELG
ncbi:MAG: ROK family protein [Solirubrobacteraceae bacterium]|nr:MAG: sugar kinase [Solirubrobacterales bacterium]